MLLHAQLGAASPGPFVDHVILRNGIPGSVGMGRSLSWHDARVRLGTLLSWLPHWW